MAETSLEEAFRKVQATTAYVPLSAGVAAALDDAIRALLLVGLEAAAAEEGNPFPLEGEGLEKLRRRIEELGR